jgi:hypothetical protein
MSSGRRNRGNDARDRDVLQSASVGTDYADAVFTVLDLKLGYSGFIGDAYQFTDLFDFHG